MNPHYPCVACKTSIVLTETVARKYFDDENLLGQTISYDTRVDLTVTGVIADLPHSTHFAFNMLASHESIVPVYFVNVGAF